MNYLLSAQNIHKSFGDYTALSGANINIKPGSIVGLVGESGCGKTTLARIISGLEYLDTGNIILENHELSQIRTKIQKSNIQLIFQNALGSFNPKFTIRNSLEQPLQELNLDKTQVNLEELCHDLVLDPALLTRYPHQVSGGQIQRFAIMRAIIVKPKLLIADEPTSALDMTSKIEILKLISELRAKYNLSFLIITHDIMSLKNLVDYIYVMHKGIIVESGSPSDIINNPAQKYTQKLINAIPVLKC